MKISFVWIWMKTTFHNKNFALSLALTMRFIATRKWPNGRALQRYRRGSNPVQPWNCFQAFFSKLLNLRIRNCDDHSLIHSFFCSSNVHVWIFIYNITRAHPNLIPIGVIMVHFSTYARPCVHPMTFASLVKEACARYVIKKTFYRETTP